MTAFLKVPLLFFQSATVALFPDETHQSIRRTFSSPFRDHLRHQFCGFCGTQLSLWDDSSRDHDNYIWVTLGSLADEDVDKLEDMGILDALESEGEDDGEAQRSAERSVESASSAVTRLSQDLVQRGAPWFESLVQDTAFGRIKRQKGGHMSADGSSSVQWEVVEFTTGDDSEPGTPNKRKIDDMDAGEDESAMQA